MRLRPWRVSIGLLPLLCGPLAVPSFAQQAADSVKVVQLTGMSGAKEHTKGALKVENGNLQFLHSKEKTELPAASIQDVVTGNDSQRAVHGFLGTITQFGPYGSGRFLSLFRSKLDTLTLQYTDADGGLHGAIFTMPVGKADALKKLLVAQGAHTSIPVQENTPTTDAKPDAAKEHKP
jgi:hypothetical protein